MGPEMTKHEAMLPQFIQLNLKARDKAGLLNLLSETAAHFTGLDKSAILVALCKREALGSTGVGNAIALPHTSIFGLESPFGLLALLNHPIDFGSVDAKPVETVFVLLTPQNDAASDLALLSAIARRFRSGDLVSTLRKATTEAEALAAWNDLA